MIANLFTSRFTYYSLFAPFSIFFAFVTSLCAYEEPDSKVNWIRFPQPLFFSADTMISPGLEPGTIWTLVPTKATPPKASIKLRLTSNGPQKVQAIGPGAFQLSKFLPTKSAQPMFAPVPLDLDDNPSFFLDHPTGILVFCNGDLFRFRPGRNEQSPWIKEILVMRIDQNPERSVGRIYLDLDGSIRLLISPGKTQLKALDNSTIKQRGNSLLLGLRSNGSNLEILNELVNAPLGQGLVWTVFGEPYLIANEPREIGSKEPQNLPISLIPIYPGMAATNQNKKTRTKFSLWEYSSQTEPFQTPMLVSQNTEGEWNIDEMEKDGDSLRTSDKKHAPQRLGKGGLFLWGGPPGTWIIGESTPAGDKTKLDTLSGYATLGQATIKLEKSQAEPGQMETKSSEDLAVAFVSQQKSLNWPMLVKIQERIDNQKILNPKEVPPIVAALHALLKAHDQGNAWEDPFRIHFLACLANSGDRESINLIRDWAESASPLPRSYALSLLKRFIQPDDNSGYQIVLNGLADEDLRVKASALRTLGTIPFPGSANALIGAYSFDSGQNPHWRSALISAISNLAHKQPSLYRQILEMAESGNADSLKKAIDFFAITEDAAAVGSILDLLNYPHLTPKDQTILLRAIQPVMAEGNAERLINWLDKLENPTVEVLQIGLEKIEGTKTIGGQSTFTLLKNLMKSSDPDKRWIALAVFKKQKYKDGEEWLKKIPPSGILSPVQMRALEEAVTNQRAIREGVTPP